LLSENTGHGVRASQRINPLIRPLSATSVLTCPPYRAAGTEK
jgi:hypothetical protein